MDTTCEICIKGNLETFIRRELDAEVDFKFYLCGYYGTDSKGMPHRFADTVPTYIDLVGVAFFLRLHLECFNWREANSLSYKKTNTSKTNTIYTTDARKETNYLQWKTGIYYIRWTLLQMFLLLVCAIVEGGEKRLI